MFRYKLVRVEKGDVIFPSWFTRFILRLLARTFEMRLMVIRWMIRDLAKHTNARPYGEWMVLRALVISTREYHPKVSLSVIEKDLAQGVSLACDDSLWIGDEYVMPKGADKVPVNYGDVEAQWCTLTQAHRRAYRDAMVEAASEAVESVREVKDSSTGHSLRRLP